MATATIKIIYVWTQKVPGSLSIKKKFEESIYGNLMTFICADSADVRNTLMFGKYPQMTVPIFIIQESDGTKQTTNFYQQAEIDKVFAILDSLIEGMEQPFDDTRSMTIGEEHLETDEL